MHHRFFNADENKKESIVNPIQTALFALENYLAKFPEKEFYRLVVDGDLHSSENGWIEFEEREPGCLRGIFNGLAFAITYLEDTKLTLDLIKKIHQICMTAVETSFAVTPGKRRQHRSGYRIGSDGLSDEKVVFNFLKEMEVQEQKEETRPFKKFKFVDRTYRIYSLQSYMERNEVSDLHSLAKKVSQDFHPRRSCHSAYKRKKNRGHYISPPMPHVLEKEAQNLIKKYNDAIILAKNQEEKLDAIINFINDFEFLHYFADGNTRTLTLVLMQRLLLQHGFQPVALFDPNMWYHLSTHTEIIQQIKFGMMQTEKILQGKKSIYEFETSAISKQDQQRYDLFISELRNSIPKEIQRLKLYENLRQRAR